jgi:hypothetical protein
MTMTEVEKSSRSILERTFYTKLGPTPAFPPSPAETGQVKPGAEAMLAHRAWAFWATWVAATALRSPVDRAIASGGLRGGRTIGDDFGLDGG